MASDEPHPLIMELIKMLPPPGSQWARAERVKWLKACVAVFAVVYDDGKVDGLEIEIGR